MRASKNDARADKFRQRDYAVAHKLSQGKVASFIVSAPSRQDVTFALVGQIRFVTRSLRRYAPCPHCIRFAHFNRVRLRVSPFAQDDALKVTRCEHVKMVTPSATATPHPAHFSRKDNPSVVLTHATSPGTGEATDALLSITELSFCFCRRKHFKTCSTQRAA